MKKYILFPLLVGLIPNVVFGASARYTQLVREKQRKMEQLEKCMGASKGLKIAGVSTLGLTAVGVAGNIYEAKVIKDTDTAIEKVDKKIEKTQQEIAEKQAQKAEEDRQEKEKQEEAARKAAEAKQLQNVAREDIKRIESLGDVGDVAYSRGYDPEQLPDDLRNKFADAMIGFIGRCKAHEKTPITKISMGTAESEGKWTSIKNNSAVTALGLEDPIENLNDKREIAKCEIDTCYDKYHKQGNACVPDEGENGSLQQDDNNNGDADNQQKQQSGGQAGGQQGGQQNQSGNTTLQGGQGGETIYATRCTPEYLDQHNAATGKDIIAEDDKKSYCFILTCKQGYHTTLNGQDYKIKSYNDLDTDVVCTKDAVVTQTTAPKAKLEPVATEPTPISSFNATKVNLEEGKKLVEIWGKTQGKNLIYKTESVNRTGQDYITYLDSASNTEYQFEFDSLNKTSAPSERKRIIGEKVCEMLGGSYSYDWNTNNIYCENADCKEWKNLAKSVTQAGGHTLRDATSADKCAMFSY